VGNDVVHLTGDAPAFVGGRVLGQLRLRFLLGNDQPLLSMHEIADQPTHSDKTQVKADRV
jgi:hypothetical protein